MARKAEGGNVIVGFTAAYALPVHENVGANFKAPGTQAKFLEQPAREEMGGPARRTIEELLAKGKSLLDALLVVGLRIQRKSQQITPIDTGNLRASAFTRKE